MFKRTLITILALASLFLTACSGGDLPASSNPSNATDDTQRTKVRIGVVGENNEQWTVITQMLKEEGIDIELVRFADYSLPNRALADGEIELNAFQHHAFLEDQIQDQGFELTAIGDTIIAPLGVYSTKITSLAELPEKGTIAIPNDATNGGRALKVLETAGIIKIDPAAGFVPTLSDITENPKNIQFYEVEAAQTFRLMADVDAAVINGGHARDNDLSPRKDSIYLEAPKEGEENPYINVIVSRTADKDNPIFQRIVDAYRSDAVGEVIDTVYAEAYLKTW